MKTPVITSADGILLLYHYLPWRNNASTILEHVNAFQRYSQFPVWNVNAALGFPNEIRSLNFQIIVLHYSLFANLLSHSLSQPFYDFLERSDKSYKVAFFQDEHHSCQMRFAFINSFHIDCIYTLLEPIYFKETYLKYTQVPKLVHTLPGYVSEELLKIAQTLCKPREARKIDIGYRGRNLPPYMGSQAQEKTFIAQAFEKLASGRSLKIDFDTRERCRLYGKRWYEFLADCKGVLGVEAGVSIFDLEGAVYAEFEKLSRENSQLSYEAFKRKCPELLESWEDRIYYRTISPRHFEAAAFRICQILFEGNYSGILKPMIHYIPLRKDFSNFEEVICNFKDATLCKVLTQNAYRDLIESQHFTYEAFIRGFDEELKKSELKSTRDVPQIVLVNESIGKDKIRRFSVSLLRYVLYALQRKAKRTWQYWIQKFAKAPTTGANWFKMQKLWVLLRNAYELLESLYWGIAAFIAKAPKGPLVPIQIVASGKATGVDTFWADHTVKAKCFKAASQSQKYLDWRFSVYPLFQEFTGLYGTHDDQVVLDYGCGPGNDLVGFLIYTKAKKIIGMDVSLKSLGLAQRRLSLHMATSNRLQLIRLHDSVPTLLLDENFVDYINCQGVLHHTTNPELVLNEFFRVLKHNSWACIMVYNRDSLWYHLVIAYYKMLVRKEYRGMNVDEAFSKSTDTPDCPISRCYRHQDFIDLCNNAGFGAEYAGGYFALPELKLYKKFVKSAPQDERLALEHRKFINELIVDERGFPKYQGKHAGIGGVYKLHKK